MEDIDKLKKLVKAMDDLVEVGEAIMKDGKVDFMDAQHLPKLAPVMSELLDVFKHRKELLAEGKDLDWKEIVELGNEVMK